MQIAQLHFFGGSKGFELLYKFKEKCNHKNDNLYSCWYSACPRLINQKCSKVLHAKFEIPAKEKLSLNI